MTETTDPAATLAGIKQRYGWNSDRYADPEMIRESLEDIPPLLAAVEAALKAADGWKYIHSARCAREVREAITTALLGEETDDDGHA